MKSICWFFLIFLCGWSFSTLANVTVKAVAVPPNLPPKDMLELVVTVQYEEEGDIQSPRLPDLSDFYLGGQRSSKNISIINGEVSKEMKYHYSLRPRKEGVFIIDSVEVVVEGQLYKTKPVKVKVSSKFPSRPRSQGIFGGLGKGLKGFFAPDFFDDWDQRSPSPAFDFKDEDLSLDLKIGKRKIYIGEMIVAEWNFSLPNHQFIPVEPSLKKTVDIEGFWSEPLLIFGNPLPPPEIVRKNDREYRRQVIQSSALFPVKTGTLTIGPLSVDFHIRSLSFFGSGKVLSKKTLEKKIQVLPLPAAGKDESFTEAVGDFSLTAKVNKVELSGQDPLIYTVTFTGQGHPRTIQLPSLKFPDSLEIYDTTQSQTFSVEESTKIFEILLIPKTTGKIVIPQFELSTFNPELGVYTTHILPSIELNVLGVPVQNQGADEQYFKDRNKNSSEDLIFVPASNQEPSFFSASNRKKIWLVLYIFLFLCFIWAMKRNGFFVNKKRKPLEILIIDTEKKVEEFLQKQNWKKIGIELNQLIYLVLSESSGYNRPIKNLDVLIHNLHPSLRSSYESQIRSLVSDLERLSFAPERLAKSLRTEKTVQKMSREVFALLKKMSVS